MGQYYYAIILDAAGKIVVWMHADVYGEGIKLMEHSYLDSSFVNTFEYHLSPEGSCYKSRVVWAGDYADKENGEEKNLYEKCDESTVVRPDVKSAAKYRYIVNHTKRRYVDKKEVNTVHLNHTKRRYVDKNEVKTIHPLPLLTVEGNGRGGGDLGDAPSWVGSWSRDVISVEEAVPEGFEQLVMV